MSQHRERPRPYLCPIAINVYLVFLSFSSLKNDRRRRNSTATEVKYYSLSCEAQQCLSSSITTDPWGLIHACLIHLLSLLAPAVIPVGVLHSTLLLSALPSPTPLLPAFLSPSLPSSLLISHLRHRVSRDSHVRHVLTLGPFSFFVWMNEPPFKCAIRSIVFPTA